MISLLPTSSPAETTAAYTLLAVIADPQAAKQRLDDLFAERAKLEGVLKDVQDATAAHVAKVADADAAHADWDAKITAREEAVKRDAAQADAAHAVRTKQVEDHADVLADTQKRLEALDSAIAAREADVAKRESIVRAAAADLEIKSAVAEQAARDAQALKAAYEGKEAALQAALSAAPKNYNLQAETGRLGAAMGEVK